MNKSKILFWLFLIIPVLSMAAKMNIINLPKPMIMQSMYLNKAIQKRRSVRHFTTKSLNMEQLSLLLWSAQGITDIRRALRAAPSAGALYPLEIYLVEADGVWHYLVQQHALQQVISSDLRAKLFKAALSQSPIDLAPVNLVIAADFARTTAKYGQRGNRYVHMEVGHASQNILLEAQSLGLAAVTIGAFNDVVVNKLLRLSGGQTALYIISVGYAK